jgi:hypothetical protein
MLGYAYRKRSTNVHKFWNSAGVFFNLSAAIFLLALKYLMGGLENAGIYPAVDRWIINVHRAFATLALFIMLAMLFSGILRKRKIHVGLHYVFIPLYTVVYFSGLFLFKAG